MTPSLAPRPPRIVIAAGGTAGHVVPAIAIADALRAEGADVLFVGGERAEAELVPAAGYPLEAIRVEGISRTNPLKAARAVVRAAGAVRAAGRILDGHRADERTAARRFDGHRADERTAARILDGHRADAVLGGGGYVAGPVGLAAVRRGIPLVLSEADSHLGLANRLLAGRARRVCLAFPIAGREGEPYRVTGRPVPPTVSDRAGARAQLGVPADAICVLVFGGSLGARSINVAALEALAGAPYAVLHVAGRRDYPELAPRAAALGDGYRLLEYVQPFGTALAAADLAVARAGGSVFELAQYGLPAVLVPYPHAAGDHQTGNARWMERAGAAAVVPDAELTADRLRAEVDAIATDPERRAAMAAAARALARPDAARVIAGEVLAAARSRGG